MTVFCAAAGRASAIAASAATNKDRAIFMVVSRTAREEGGRVQRGHYRSWFSARPYVPLVAWALILSNSTDGRAQADTIVTRELAPGVAYRQFVDKTGPVVAYLVRVNLRDAGIELRQA